jgi:hypothetical protein
MPNGMTLLLNRSPCTIPYQIDLTTSSRPEFQRRFVIDINANQVNQVNHMKNVFAEGFVVGILNNALSGAIFVGEFTGCGVIG